MSTVLDQLGLLWGFAGLANPIALIVGAVIGCFADNGVKCAIAGFVAAVVSVLAETLLRAAGLEGAIAFSGGVLAVLPVRAVGAACIAYLAMRVCRHIRQR